jgi:hypothetical protein
MNKKAKFHIPDTLSTEIYSLREKIKNLKMNNVIAEDEVSYHVYF